MASHKKKVTFAVNENSGAARSKSRSPSSPSPPHSLVPDRSGSASFGHSPRSDNAPGSRPSCSSQPHEVHCICLSDKEVGHMIECEGCLRWSHSKCVSISATLAKNYPFICPFCTRALFQEVTSLRSEVSQLREQLAKCSVVSQSCQEQHASEHASLTPPISPNGDSGQSTSSSVNGDSRHQLKSSSRQDRCCNLVVHGISECPQGTRRTERALRDQDSIISVLSPLCPSLATHSIRDLLRLGKYNVHRSRPILVKLHRPLDASVILSNTRRLSDSPGISIRRDLSSADREVHSILIKERRSLLSSGVNSCDVKIKATSLYVPNSLYGEVVYKSFVHVNPPTVQLPTVPSSTAPIAPPTDQQPISHTASDGFAPSLAAPASPHDTASDSASGSFQ